MSHRNIRLHLVVLAMAPLGAGSAFAGGALFFGCSNGTVYSLSSGGSLLWLKTLPTGGTISGPVCVANGVVYATDDSDTYALDQNSGVLLATLPVASLGGFAVVNGALFAGDDFDNALTRFTPNGLLSNFVAPRPEPMHLRPHPRR